MKWLVVGPRGAKKIIKGMQREQFFQRRGAGGRRSGARGGPSGANRLPLRQGSPRRPQTANTVRPESLIPQPNLLPSTRQASKRKEREDTAGAEEEEEEMEEGATSPARKK